ncbi:hypothetical protein Aspvir_005887 [Aspergillus viridinutans]|uniref:Uncharacterized protein n=1 Tax=Aspergillus viridinutans TaxID=75553 RepID=A0A9P3BXX7_ASPVI|nr:uncharacterized protein Aspvir_005887 [Aspergillus viridinutans]GIK01846.1 hypothetical protein Aspvir_005887 [Aspergillus viridinutans]
MTADDDETQILSEMERQRAEAALREAAARAAAEKQAREDHAAVTRGLTDQATMQQLSSSGHDAQRRRKKN